jgi:hypothetical protein
MQWLKLQIRAHARCDADATSPAHPVRLLAFLVLAGKRLMRRGWLARTLHS